VEIQRICEAAATPVNGRCQPERNESNNKRIDYDKKSGQSLGADFFADKMQKDIQSQQRKNEKKGQ